MDSSPSAFSSVAFDGWRAVASLDGQLRRALLRAQRGTVLQDWIDCAELALAAEHRSVARMLYGYIFLQVGFSPSGLAMQAEVDHRTKLWGDLPVRASAPLADRSVTGFSVDLAIAELGRLMQLEATLDHRPPPSNATPFDASIATRRQGPEAEDRIRVACERVAALLQAVPRLEAEGRLAQMLRDLADELITLPPAPLENHIDQDVIQLATLLALGGLKRFILEVDDCLHAVPHAGGLFGEAGRLAPAALGPYFANLRLVIRNAHDIFAFIQAASQIELNDEDVESWCLLISARLREAELMELVDEVGDRGMTRALGVLLARTKRLSSVEPQKAVLCHIRDAALDLREDGLAIEAQQFVISKEPENALEWMVLGEILGGLGDPAGAEAAITQCFRLSPEDKGALARLTALKSGLFDQFAASGGYASAPWRRRLRLARVEARRP